MVRADPHRFFFTKEWDWAGETGYRLMLRGATNGHEYIDVHSCSDAVLIGPRFPKVYRPSLQDLCDELEVQALAVLWEGTWPALVRMSLEHGYVPRWTDLSR